MFLENHTLRKHYVFLLYIFQQELVYIFVNDKGLGEIGQTGFIWINAVAWTPLITCNAVCTEAQAAPDLLYCTIIIGFLWEVEKGRNKKKIDMKNQPGEFLNAFSPPEGRVICVLNTGYNGLLKHKLLYHILFFSRSHF